MKNYAILAHAMKSDSKYLGFKKLAELALNHELKGKEDDSNYVNENYDELEVASGIIKEGGIVLFPTETVYGIGANGLDENAVKKIFIAKGRANDNPLIVHFSDIESIKEAVLEITPEAMILLSHFSPGPLTVILKKSDKGLKKFDKILNIIYL